MACNTSPTTGEFYCDDTQVGFPPSSTPPAGTVSHSVWDWASLVADTGAGLLTRVQQSGTPKPTPNLGIPGAKTPTPPPVATSKVTGYAIAAVIIGVLILAFRRVMRR